jgi:hypothetical protein
MSAQICRCVAALLVFLAPSLCWAEGDARNAACMGCHTAMSETQLSFPDGSGVSIGVDPDDWSGSVHASLACTDCHTATAGFPHAKVEAENLRDYQVAQAATCNRCHYAYYTRALDGIHYRMFEGGNKAAPTCVDCHGSHAVRSPRSPRIEVDRRCARCHPDVAEVYERSVHGRALIDEDNQDVPVCTDCHGAHAIADPDAPEFHASEHTICARCHADAERMAPYGLNPQVVTTYLDDFHGASNKLIADGAGTPAKALATCSDCHGVHDIEPFDKSGGRAVVRQRVVSLCERCHEDVPETFADAWLSHYPASFATAPLVASVTWAYRVLIPVIMLGLVLHILLHLWRIRVHR